MTNNLGSNTNGIGDNGNGNDGNTEQINLTSDPTANLANLRIGYEYKYDDYTTIDWLQDNIKDRKRLRILKLNSSNGRSDVDAIQAWIILLIVGMIVGLMTSLLDLLIPWLENTRLDLIQLAHSTTDLDSTIGIPGYSFLISISLYCISGLVYSAIAFFICSQAYSPTRHTYDAAGSGIPQVKVILGGFVIRGFLGFKTLAIKYLALLFAVSAGLMVGVQGPLVHMACAVGNVTTRLFEKYRMNDAKRREIMSAACAAGVSAAFGAPIGGVLFSLEEVSYYFPHKTMWRSFFCAMVASICIKMINPLGEGKLVMFAVSYDQAWHALEMIPFGVLGICGGLFGATFIKVTSWLQKYRVFGPPLVELLLISLITSLTTFPLVLGRLSNTRLVADLFQKCPEEGEPTDIISQLCHKETTSIITQLLLLLFLKTGLMAVTHRTLVPGGVFIPCMVVGALGGRLVGTLLHPYFPTIIPGMYALVGAAAVLSGVTRMTISLSVIMFELTGGLGYVVPVMVAVMTSKWVADSISRDSVYDGVIRTEGWPFLDLKHLSFRKSGTAGGLAASTAVLDVEREYTATQLREMVDLEGLETGFPVIKGPGLLVGQISAIDINHMLDKIIIDEPQNTPVLHFASLCATPSTLQTPTSHDLSPWVDLAPLVVYTSACIDLLFELFAKLGMRCVFVVREGIYVGTISKKDLLEYLHSSSTEELATS